MTHIDFKRTAITMLGLCLIAISGMKGKANPNHPVKDFSRKSVIEIADKVAGWQIQNFEKVKHHPLSWPNGAFYLGLFN